MYKKILFMALIMSQWALVNSQTISRKSISSAGSTLTGGSYMVTFNIGETVIPTLSAGGSILTQGFEQPGEQIVTGTIPAAACSGTAINVPFTAMDLLATNTYTAQLSNAAGSFASPVNIGTLAGNSNTGTIVATIPANTPTGNGYKVRVVGSVPLTIGSPSANTIVVTGGVHINDPNFAAAIRRQCATCLNDCDNLTAAADGVTSLDVRNSNISDFTGLQGFINLVYFNGQNNRSTVLPNGLANSLSYLDCTYNRLTTLPTPLPTGLQYLHCGNNQLSALPPLPSGLIVLYCNDNQLATLPTLPTTLLHLYAYNNRLTALPTLPNGLTELIVYNNRLTALPTLPSSLIQLMCNNNLLSSLPTLPNSIENVDCHNNNIGCLPALPNSMKRLRIDNDKILCLPNGVMGMSVSNAAGNSIIIQSCTPTVGIHPSVSNVIDLGSEVILRASATSSEGTTVKWQLKRPTDGSFSDIAGTLSPYTSNTTTTYTIASVATSDYDVQYQAVFMSSCAGMALSRSAVIAASVVPIELVSFTGKAESNLNRLNWTVATQINVAHYTIERSGSGVDSWRNIGQVEAQRDSKTTLFYSFDDTHPLSLTYYRLKIVDVDGKLSYSKVISVTQSARKMAIQKVFPNPVNDLLTIDIDVPEAVSTTLTISDVLGRSIESERLATHKGLNTFTINLNGLAMGTYFLTVNDGQTQRVEKIVKQ